MNRTQSIIATKQIYIYKLEVISPETKRSGTGSEFAPGKCDGLVSAPLIRTCLAIEPTVILCCLQATKTRHWL
ncbi:MAG: hypothetical protein HUJ51_00900 [Eggerthellaceae bacterium]|nr:hypothetical protein [Eggerthellaceae bacterium]